MPRAFDFRRLFRMVFAFEDAAPLAENPERIMNPWTGVGEELYFSAKLFPTKDLDP